MSTAPHLPLAEMKRLRDLGDSYADIGRRFGVDRHTVRYWLDEAFRQTRIGYVTRGRSQPTERP